MSLPIYIVDIFTDINAKMMAAIQENGSSLLQAIKANETSALGSTKIETIDYRYGHLLELIETMSQMDASRTERTLKYPLHYLAQDFTERRGRKEGIYTEVSLRVILAHQTVDTYKITDRYAKVFKPVLYPIYYEFLNQVALHPAILEAEADLIEHDKTDRSYWGRTSGEGNDANKLNDFVDAIEITNLKLNFYTKNC